MSDWRQECAGCSDSDSHQEGIGIDTEPGGNFQTYRSGNHGSRGVIHNIRQGHRNHNQYRQHHGRRITCGQTDNTLSDQCGTARRLQGAANGNHTTQQHYNRPFHGIVYFTNRHDIEQDIQCRNTTECDWQINYTRTGSHNGGSKYTDRYPYLFALNHPGATIGERQQTEACNNIAQPFTRTQ